MLGGAHDSQLSIGSVFIYPVALKELWPTRGDLNLQVVAKIATLSCVR